MTQQILDRAAAGAALHRYALSVMKVSVPLTDSTQFDEAGLDSLDLIELVGEAEAISGAKVANEELGEVKCLADLLDKLYPTQSVG